MNTTTTTTTTIVTTTTTVTTAITTKWTQKSHIVKVELKLYLNKAWHYTKLFVSLL